MTTTRRLHDGYTLVGGSTASDADLRQRRRPAPTRLRELVVLAALVLALCVGLSSFLWEPHRPVHTSRDHVTHADGGDMSTSAGVTAVDRSEEAHSASQDLVREENALEIQSGLSLELSTWPTLVEDGGDLVVFWRPADHDVVQKEDYITLSCGPTFGDDDYLQRKNVTETDAAPTSVRFSGNTACFHAWHCVTDWQHLAH